MDNITHSLLGYAVARALPERVAGSGAQRRATVWASVVASNLPDADIALGLLFDNRKLAYLLHHRGHTHTLIAALPLAALTALVLARLSRPRSDPWQTIKLFGVALIAALLHVLFDFFNEYGVHPFYPWDNRWRYGDFIFIVEPLLILSLTPLLALYGASRTGRITGWGISLGLLALLFGLGMVPTSVAVFATAWFSLVVGLNRFVRSGAAPALTFTLAALLLYHGGAMRARAGLLQRAAMHFPDEQVVELVTSPVPGNPLCWSAKTVSVDVEGNYFARAMSYAVVPKLFDAKRCTFRAPGQTAPMWPVSAPSDRRLTYHGEFKDSVDRLRTIAATHCEGNAMFQFLRVAYWRDDQEGTILGDLRYDHEEGLGFAEMRLDAEADRCPESRPAWVPPLWQLL